MAEQTNEVRLKVGELTAREEAGRGIVRIDSSTMSKLGTKEGDVIEIEGSKITAAIAVRAYPADVGLNIIRMDGITRRNAGSGVGEYVKLRKSNVKEANSVTLAPAQKGVMIHIAPNLIKQNIYMRPMVKGDIIVPAPAGRRRSSGLFEDFFGFDFEDFFFTPFSGETRFVVTSTNPAGVVRIGEITELEILPQLPESMKLEERAVPTVTYEDVGGIREIIHKIREMIELPLRHPELFERLGIEAPKGVLLYGPPGTGKTLLAKAVANESGAYFISISAPEVMCVDEKTPIIYNQKVLTAKEIFESSKGERVGAGENHVSYSANGILDGIRNPSLANTEAQLLETTQVKVPYYYNMATDTSSYNVSSNHPILTLSRNGIAWKTPGFLNEKEDLILTQVIKNLEKPRIDFKSTELKVPTVFTNELALLLGMVAGDGYVGDDNVVYTVKDANLHKKFQELIKSIFGISKYSFYKNEEADRTAMYSTELVKFFNYIGFKSGKKDYKKFLEKWLNKFDQQLFIMFIAGLLVSDGTRGKHSLVIYSIDEEALSIIRNVGFSRGFVFEGPKKHTNKLSSVKKIILKGKYNLEHFYRVLSEANLIEYPSVSSERSFEYVPTFIISMIKNILRRLEIHYGENYAVEPYINLRKMPTLHTLETLLAMFKNKEEKLNEFEKNFLNVVQKVVRRELLLDRISVVRKVNEEKTMYDFGTTTDNFVTAYGHIMHNSKWYGESEANIKRIFEEAEKNAPSIIFIDEIDAIAPKREEVSGEVERRVVSTLLTQMDGLKARGKVIVIAATNRPNSLDSAIRRAGRFDREIEFPVPDREGRLEIFKIHTRNMPLAKDVDLNHLADVTYGFVGADVWAVGKEAAMSALRRILPEIKWKEDEELPKEIIEKLIVTKEDFENALRVVEPSAMREVMVEIPKVKWTDIGGLEDVKEQLQEMIEWPLKYPGSFDKMGITPPRGILLYGPPGTGKTLLAKAVANEAGANFISIKGPEMFSKWVGESERAIRDVFRRARQVAPAIIFLDEIDSIAPRRGMFTGSAITETVVSQLLSEISGLEELKGVVVMAATNRPDIVDPALLRPGRFDRMVLVLAPDYKARIEIFKVHTKKMPLTKDVDLKELARKAEGFSGADIESLCREAGMDALREDKKAKEVKMKHFEDVLSKMTPSITRDVMSYYEKFAERKRRVGREEKEVVPRYIG